MTPDDMACGHASTGNDSGDALVSETDRAAKRPQHSYAPEAERLLDQGGYVRGLVGVCTLTIGALAIVALVVTTSAHETKAPTPIAMPQKTISWNPTTNGERYILKWETERCRYTLLPAIVRVP